MTFPHSILTDKDQSSLTAFINGEAYTTDNTNPSWDRIVELVKNGDTSVVPLFDARNAAAQKFEAVTDRVSLRGNSLYFDGDVIRTELANHIVRAIGQKSSFMPLVRFMEKLNANPSENSREQLYAFLERHDFTINEQGNILAYKGVSRARTSISSGYAIVDGVEHNGHIPNEDGSVISMPRSRVEDNRDVACSHGLHAGTYAYANGFGPVVLLVEVDPVNVVSVPSDCNDQKIRCCKYTVLEQIDSEYDSAIYESDPEDYDDEEDDFDSEAAESEYAEPKSYYYSSTPWVS